MFASLLDEFLCYEGAVCKANGYISMFGYVFPSFLQRETTSMTFCLLSWVTKPFHTRNLIFKDKNSAEGYVVTAKTSFPQGYSTCLYWFDFSTCTSKSANYTGVAETRSL